MITEDALEVDLRQMVIASGNHAECNPACSDLAQETLRASAMAQSASHA